MQTLAFVGFNKVVTSQVSPQALLNKASCPFFFWFLRDRVFNLNMSEIGLVFPVVHLVHASRPHSPSIFIFNANSPHLELGTYSSQSSTSHLKL